MRTPSKIIVAVALAGMAVAGGAAFTGGGLINSEPNQFIGGTATQAITGATLSSVNYTYTQTLADHSVVSVVTLNFDSATPEGSPVTMKLEGKEFTAAVGETPASYADASFEANGFVGTGGVTMFTDTSANVERADLLTVTVDATTATH